jgi:hypothetical protein
VIKLKEGLPDFYVELEQLLRKRELEELVLQLPDLEITHRCDCDEHNCATFQVEASRKLNVVESNIIGVRHGDSFDLDAETGMVVVDTDNFGRITGFEVLGRKDVSDALDAAGV